MTSSLPEPPPPAERSAAEKRALDDYSFKVWFQRAVKTMFAGVVISILAVGAIMQTNDSDRREDERRRQADLLVSRENGYKNRAIVCQAILTDGDNRPTPLPCKEPEVTKYYDTWVPKDLYR